MHTHHPQALSKVLYWLSLAALLAIPLILAAVWLLGDPAMFSSGEAQHYFNPATIPLNELNTSMRLAGLSLSLLANLALLYGLWHLRQLFQCFIAGQYFNEPGIRHLKCFALGLLLTGISYPIGGALLSLVLSSLDSQQGGYLAITLGDQQVSLLFIGGVLYAIATIMGEGQRLQDDLDQIV